MPKQISSRSLVRVLCGLTVVAVAIALYFMPWIERSVDNGYTAEALRRPYLAAEQFLARFSVEVRARDGLELLDDLPPSGHTLLIASSRRALSERRSNDLMAWVMGGGRLILLAGDLWDDDLAGSGDRLLDDLEVQLLELTDDETQEVETTDDSSFTRNLNEVVLAVLDADGLCGKASSLSQVSLTDEEQEITVSFHSRRLLAYEGDLEFSYAENLVGPQLLYIVVGEGAVVVTTTLHLWRNRVIGCADHAHFLRWLVDDRPVLWWLYNTEMPGLARLIWQRWSVAVVLLLVLLGLWLWRSGLRITRVNLAPTTARRELMEHVDGVARFLWQQGEVDVLLAAQRRSVLGTLSADNPATERLILGLSRRTGTSVERIRWALFAEIGKDTSGLVAAVKLLRELRLHV